MSLTPHQSGVGSCEVQSPDIFMSDIRRNLDGQFLNARDSLQQENMCIFARVRPMLPHELSKGFKECIAAVDEKTIRTVIPVSSSRYKSSRESEEIEDFSFSAAFGPETGQFLFFLKTMLPTLQNFVENGNSLVFSYGITGSGRTYTLQGDFENPGIIPLSLRLYFAAVEKQLLDGIKVKPHMYDDIIALSAAEQKEEHRVKKQLLSLYDDECEIAPGSFRSSNNKTFEMLCDFFSGDFEAEERETTLDPEEMASAQAATVMREVIRNSAESQLGICNVWVSFVEIYNESIFDLLTPVTNERKALKLRECNGNVYIKGAREICVSNGDEALKILKIGRKNLSIASTEMNDQSSRSHCFFTIKVVRVQDANNMSHGKVNRLSFCDLAGSERTAKTQTTGIRLKEAGSINTSLLVLGRCLEQLRMNQMVRDKRMIPFRDSKLTRLFSGFFLGQGKAVMIANASPCDFTNDETSHVLKFSALARKLKVNDLMIFYTDAISTLQSICNNRDSLDSDSEIIQKRDEFIEKLKSWTENLIKKEQENADIEMKIRREVCNEYSEYSDRLLEEKSIWCEEQIETMREIFEKEVANKEKMYEKIILDYKHQLNETTGSDEDAFDNNHSIMELENSAELSPEKSQNEKIIDKSEESYQFQSSKLKELQRTLESTTAELEKAKKELCESQKLVASLDKENGELKSELKILTEKINEFKEVKKYISAAKDDESKICNLEEKLISNENHFEEQLQEKQNLTSQLKKVAAEKELMESSSSISLSSDDEEEKKKVEVKKYAPKEKASNSDSSSEMLSSDFDIRTLIVKCSSCGRQINQFSNKECKRHRKLGVITCKQCYKYYGSIQFSQDELGFNYCTWCGKGGKLVACDFCPNGFCSACIRRNFGRAEISVTTKEGWKCYCCNKKSLKPKIKFCNLVLEDKKKIVMKAFNESKEACKRFHREMATLKTIGLNKSKSLRHIVKKMEEVITRHKTDLKNVLISLTKQFDTDSSDSD